MADYGRHQPDQPFSDAVIQHSTDSQLFSPQVLNGMAITLIGSPLERVTALAELEALPQVNI